MARKITFGRRHPAARSRQGRTDAVVVIGSNLEASILTASLLVSFGIGTVWAKAISEERGRVLTRLGVHRVVFPGRPLGESAVRTRELR